MKTSKTKCGAANPATQKFTPKMMGGGMAYKKPKMNYGGNVAYESKMRVQRKDEAEEQEKAIAQIVSYRTWGAASVLSIIGFYCLYEFTSFL